LQDQKLMPECKNLCLQNSASSETISQREEYGQHGLGRLPFAILSVNATISMGMDFLVGTGGNFDTRFKTGASESVAAFGDQRTCVFALLWGV